MKKRFLFFIILIIYSPIQAKYTADKMNYRKARNRDMHQLLNIYINVNQKDSKNIVTYPEIFTRKKLLKHIKTGHLFVTTDPSQNFFYFEKNKRINTNEEKIVSILKMFVMYDTDKYKNILTKEIRCIKKEHIELRHFMVPINNSLFNFKNKSKFLSEQKKNYTNTLSPVEIIPIMSYKYVPEEQTYIYYGAAYTLPEYRRCGLNTYLKRTALESIETKVLENINYKNSKQLIYVYGEVIINNKRMRNSSIRVFAEYADKIKLLLNQKDTGIIHINYFGFKAYLPKFKIESNKLKLLPDSDEREGRGRLLICNIDTDRMD